MAILTRRLPFLSMVAAGLLAGSGVACAGDATYKRTAELTVQHQSQSAIEVEARNGSIEIVGDEGASAVSIVAEIKAQTQARAEGVLIVADRGPDGALKIQAIWPEGKPLNNEGCSFEVNLPDADGVMATTSNGSIEISGLGGLAKLQSSNGRVQVMGHSGPVEAGTSNGRIEVSDASGPVDAKTSNGRIELEDVMGPVSARTSNGSVSVSLERGASGPVEIKTSNGSIDFEFAPGFEGTLVMSCGRGSIQFTDANGRTVSKKGNFELEVGAGGPVCELATSNGSITVSVED